MTNPVISPNKAVAIELARMGLGVFPCESDANAKTYKEPLTTHGFYDASNDEAIISKLWDKHSDALPAIWPGPCGLVVIDCDVKNGHDGINVFNNICNDHGINQSHFFATQTPSRGVHFYFRTDILYGNGHSLGKGIDVRGAGGYVIAPGAPGYELIAGSWDTIPLFPEMLVPFLTPHQSSTAPELPIAASTRPEATEREKRYALPALQDECKNFAALPARTGIRNKKLNDTALSVATMVAPGWLDAQLAWNALWEATASYRAQDGDTVAYKTMVSGWTEGLKRPRDPLPIVSVEQCFETKRSIKLEKAWPVPISQDAYIGIAGEFIRLIAPQTEGDSNALLIAFLTVVGSIMGRNAYMELNAVRHYPNLFSAIVGKTSSARKGTVTAEAERFAKMIDPTIAKRMKDGLSSGEGLIEHVRDERRDDVAPLKTNGMPLGEVIDKGVSDKRLLIVAGEMGGALQAAAREGNTLSATLRNAWDGKALQTLARSNKNICLEPHVSMIGNITLDELQRLLTTTDKNNGFANRFLWVCATRSKLLPFGGNVSETELQTLAAKTAHCIELSSSYGKCGWMPDGASMWAKEYARLSEYGSGLIGAISSRAEAQTLRLALIYAILDGSNNIDIQHVRAALEVWRYCQDSVHYIFENATGDGTADAILNMLTNITEGVPRAHISNHFGRNKKSDELQRALDTLVASGKVRCERHKTTGRAAEVWFAL